MRILHLDTGKEMRGGQHQALLLMRLQRDAGHDVRLLARAGAPLLEAATNDGFEAGWIAWVAVRTCAKTADIVHCHDARSHTLAALWSSAPVAVSRRVGFAVKSSVLSRWKYRNAAVYLAVSEYVKRRMIDAGIDGNRVMVVRDAVAAAPAESTRSGGAVALRSDDPGKGGALLAATALPLRYSTDLAHDFADARVFVYASAMEGLGSAALLAMSCGVPVVASNVGGLPEAVEHGVTGFVVENTPEAFRAAAQQLLNDEALACRMGRAGRERVARLFSPQSMLDATMSAYNQGVSWRR